MWLLSPQTIMLLAAMALSAIGGWRVTANHYQAEIAGMRLDKAKAAAKAEKLNHSLSVAGLELSAAISERNAARLREIDIVERDVYVSIIKYRDRPPVRPVDGVCFIDADFLRISNRAAGGGAPETALPAIGPDDRATYADVLDTVTTNYATCNKLRVQVIGWQEFYEGVRRLHER